MKLLDQFRRNGKLEMPHFVLPSKRDKWERHAAKLAGILNDRDLPAILVDNVADYFYRGTDQEVWDLQKHFPNLAPPFQKFWMEFKIPNHIHSEIGDTKYPMDLDGRVGWLMFGATRDEIEATDVPESTKWCMMGELFIDFGLRRDGSMIGPHGTTFMTLDENGQIVDRPGMMSYAHESMADFMRMHISWWNPALLAICFMHCKNVIVEHEQLNPNHVKTVRRKNNGVSPVRFRRLIIEPLKQILKREGNADSQGVAHAMHICRGHFKDYREGKGLFGKYHKLVWHPMSVRGTKGEKPAPREMEIKV